MDIVNRLAEHSMQRAVEEVQSLPDYPTKREVISLCIKNDDKNIFFLLTVGHYRCQARLDY